MRDGKSYNKPKKEKEDEMKAKKLKMACTVNLIIIIVIFMVTFMAVPNSVSADPGEKTLKIGALTNLGWPLGVDFKKFLDIAIPMLNKKGGLTIDGEKYKIEMILYDTKLNPEVGRAAVERLVYRDKVKFILGDETIDAWLPVTEKEKVLVVATTPSPAIFNPKNKYAFQASFLHTQSAVLWGWFAENHPNVKTVMNVYPDNRIGHGQNEKARKLAEMYGMKNLDTIFYPPGTKDYSAIATKVKRLNPDVVVTSGGGPIEAALLFKTLYQAGYKGIRFMTVSIPLGQIAKIMPLNMAEGLITGMNVVDLESPPPGAKEFKEAYIAKYGSWNEPEILYVNELYCLIAGLEQAQSLDPDKVAEVIGNGMKFKSLGVPAMMVKPPIPGNNRTIDLLLTTYVKKVENGKAKVLTKIDLDEGLRYWKRGYGKK